MTYQEYLEFARNILQKPYAERLISIEQINSLVEQKKRSGALESLLQLYPPYGGAFDKVIAQSLMVIRAEHAERPHLNRDLHIGVHDAVYSSSRQKTAQWLRSNFSSQGRLNRIFQILKEQIVTDNYDGPLLDSARQRYNTRQRERVNTHVWCETLHYIKKDMRDYLDHLSWKYGDGAQCGRQELILIMNWVAQAPTPEEKKDRMGLLVLAVDDARTGYHAIQRKYVPGKDYTCMPGLLERLLDAMTTIYYDAIRNRERSLPTLLVEALTNPMIKIGLNGKRCVSDTLYAAYLKAAGHRVRFHSEQRCVRKTDISEENVATLREQYIRLKWAEVLQQHTELHQKKGEKERLKKERLRRGEKTAPTMLEMTLQRDIAMLIIKLRPYLIENDISEPQTFWERLAALLWPTAEKDDQLIQSAEDIDRALRTSFDSHMEHIVHQQNLSAEQKYFGFDSIFLEDQKVTKKILIPRKQAPTSAEVFEILSKTFFLGKTHAEIVLNLSGQSPNLDLDEHHYYGLAEMAALAEAGHIPAAWETRWPKKEAWELYESYVRYAAKGEVICNLEGGEMIILEHFELSRNNTSRSFLEKCFHSQELLLKIARHQVVRKKFIKYCWELQIDKVLDYLYDQQAMNELLQEAIVGGNNIHSLALLLTKGADKRCGRKDFR